MRTDFIPKLAFCILVISISGCNGDDEEPPVVPVIGYDLVRSYPHDTSAYTEGLLVWNDSLFESTGSPVHLPWTRSVFGPVDLATGNIDVKVELDKNQYFGEGIAYLDGYFYQLTYKNRIGFIYDSDTYDKTGQFSFLSNEGWGLTTDGEALIMSDGTDQLTYIDPGTFLVFKILYVTENGFPRNRLNELEFAGGFIFANVWQTNTVVRIDTSDGKVTGRIDLAECASEAKEIFTGSREMNGIAFDPVTSNFFITGKCWPKIYEIALAD